MISPVSALYVVESEHAPQPELIRKPEKGPYFRKRLRRLRANPKNWTKPECIIAGSMIIAHPKVAHLFRSAITGASL